MGLTGIDVILHLTEGRGGVFSRQPDGTLAYRASGREPDSVVMFSCAGLFTFTRPFNAKERDTGKLEHRGVFLRTRCADCAGSQAGPSPYEAGNSSSSTSVSMSSLW